VLSHSLKYPLHGTPTRFASLIAEFLERNPSRRRDADDLARMDCDDKYTNESLRVVRQRGVPAQFVFDANANAYDDEDGSMSDEDDDEDDDGCVAPQSLSGDGVVVR
jgi:hypothetical protein